MHAAMPSSSISPYMWIVSGPSETVPVWGDGIEARTPVTGSNSARARRRLLRLQQDAERELRRTALLEQCDGPVQVYLPRRRELGSRGGCVPRALQLARAPALDPLLLGLHVNFGLGRRHQAPPRRLYRMFG